MVLKERLDFPHGLSKLVYVCTADPNHVTVVDAEAAPPGHEAGPATLSNAPIDLSKELAHERLTRLELSPDHSTLTIEAESGNRLYVKARDGGKLKVESAAKEPAQPPQDMTTETHSRP